MYFTDSTALFLDIKKTEKMPSGRTTADRTAILGKVNWSVL
jgi:hypothetical protein